MEKLNKVLRILAVAAFLTALAVNVKVTLTDPFVGMSEEAIATGTDIGSSGTDCNLCKVTHEKRGKTIIDFSCKPYPGSSCSTTSLGHTLSCENAKECSN